MRIAILESILMPAGHEVEFDRIIVEELQKLGHQVCFFVPENFHFKYNYNVPVTELAGGEAVSYAGANAMKKIFLSLRREYRRRQWFNDAYERAVRGECEAIIVPTATYRYLRTACNCRLKKSPVPVLFVIHGVNPKEKERFLEQAKQLIPFPNMKMVVLTLGEGLFGQSLPNVHCIVPPVFTPRDLGIEPEFTVHSPLKLGFFGQYRREKNVRFFLNAFGKASFSIPVELIVQGATARTEDEEDFIRLMEEYRDCPGTRFIHKSLIGKEWQQALLDVDTIMMPYAAERYRYHWGAMLFTAIGFYKPVLQSPELNPEVLARYPLGEALDVSSEETFRRQLEDFVNTFPEKAEQYSTALIAANQEFSPEKFAHNLVAFANAKC
ncbi:Hypothetical protein LUCI_4596 [Lucifera butyrica]|uniref:Glycosyl transferases group 1 n=1 Tax=Lucifera butyrica TaxID=1351585 RepID=A0A498R9C1_9FIRM|nr:glycosyltransferase [Lucifera butyrica]VBB09306.1 Hypothetical protein LUCI_4596 [Lucifera butyrica]